MKVAPPTSTERNEGLAKVEFHPSKPQVKVTMKPAEEGGTPKVYILNKEDCPETVREGVFLVTLNKEGKKMYGIRPNAGVFKMKVKEFVAQRGQDGKPGEPKPKTKTANGERGQFSYMTFTVTFEIVDDKCKGMLVPGNFPYNFEETQEEVSGHGMASVVRISHPKSTYTKRLIDFLEVTGAIKKDIPWKENILPLLQRIIIREGKTFSGAVKNGWIDALYTEESF